MWRPLQNESKGRQVHILHIPRDRRSFSRSGRVSGKKKRKARRARKRREKKRSARVPPPSLSILARIPRWWTAASVSDHPSHFQSVRDRSSARMCAEENERWWIRSMVWGCSIFRKIEGKMRWQRSIRKVTYLLREEIGTCYMHLAVPSPLNKVRKEGRSDVALLNSSSILRLLLTINFIKVN